MNSKESIFDSIIYNIIIGILAIAATIIAFIDILKNIQTPILNSIDMAIYVIFISDYIIRFLIAENKLKYIKSNIFDLISIMPFSSILRIFRVSKLFRLLKLSKLVKLTKLMAFSARCLDKCKHFLDTNGFKYMLLMATILMGIGSICIHFAENMPLRDAVWWSFVTTTTVGYGDIAPSTITGRLIACVLMIMGIGLVGSLTSAITSFFLEKRIKSENEKTDFRTLEIEQIKNSIDNIDDLTDEDIDYICRTLKAIKKKN